MTAEDLDTEQYRYAIGVARLVAYIVAMEEEFVEAMYQSGRLTAIASGRNPDTVWHSAPLSKAEIEERTGALFTWALGPSDDNPPSRRV